MGSIQIVEIASVQVMLSISRRRHNIGQEQEPCDVPTSDATLASSPSKRRGGHVRFHDTLEPWPISEQSINCRADERRETGDRRRETRDEKTSSEAHLLSMHEQTRFISALRRSCFSTW